MGVIASGKTVKPTSPPQPSLQPSLCSACVTTHCLTVSHHAKNLAKRLDAAGRHPASITAFALDPAYE